MQSLMIPRQESGVSNYTNEGDGLRLGHDAWVLRHSSRLHFSLGVRVQCMTSAIKLPGFSSWFSYLPAVDADEMPQCLLTSVSTSVKVEGEIEALTPQNGSDD